MHTDLPETSPPPAAQHSLTASARVDQARAAAEALAAELARFPQACMRNDRLSAYRQFDLDYAGAMQNEFALGLATMADGQMLAGADRFAAGKGRGGGFTDI
jgi:enoyl-CoA hydratase